MNHRTDKDVPKLPILNAVQSCIQCYNNEH